MVVRSVSNQSMEQIQGREYLSKLVNFKKSTWKNESDSVITGHAKTCLDQVQANQRTLNRYNGCVKFIDVQGTFAAFFVLPVGMVFGLVGTSIYFRENIFNIASQGFQWLRESPRASNLTSLFGGVITTAGFYEAKSGELTSVAKKLLGVLFYETAKKARDMREKSYISWEKDIKKAIETTYESMFRTLKDESNKAAQALVAESQTTDVSKLLELHEKISKLNKNLPIFQNEFKKAGFSQAQISEIFLQLTEAMQFIQKQKFALKEGSELADFGYNAGLIAGTPLSAIDKNICIPASALKNIELAKANQLGWGHKIKAVAATVAKGTVAAVSTAVITGLGAYYYFPGQLTSDNMSAFRAHPTADFPSPTGALVAGIALSGISLGGVTAGIVANRANKTAQANQDYVQKQYTEAKNKISNLYEGMMTYLAVEKADPENSQEKIAKLQSLATALNARLPTMEKIIDGYKIPDYKGTDATLKLRLAITDILKPTT